MVLTRVLKRLPPEAPVPEFNSDDDFIEWARGVLERPVAALERHEKPPNEESDWISVGAQAYHAGTLMHISQRSWLELRDDGGNTIGYINRESVAQALQILELLPFMDEGMLAELQPRSLSVQSSQ